MKKRPARREVTAPVATSRLRTSDEAILDLVMDFLRMTSDLAPHVYRDLLDGAKGNELDEKSLQEIARAWAEKWHLSGADGPCDWAVLIAVDTLKFTPRPARAQKSDAESRSNKKAEVIAMMKRAKGVTLAEIMEATSWQAHTVGGFVSILGSKGGQKIESSKNAAGERSYHIAK